MTGSTTTSGFVASGFELVQEEFERNFVDRGDLGAAFAAFRGEENLVDLCGGIADAATGAPWARDTIQIIFSGTKGLVATCLLVLLDRGLLELDQPVSSYWPEFGAAGKESVLVRDVVSHSAGLPGMDTSVSWRDATDDRAMAARLAEQPVSRDPRARSTYHALTYGWICGEIIRRIDSRSVGQFFADEIAAPLGLELWIGLPEAAEARSARVEISSNCGESYLATPEDFENDSLRWSIFGNPLRYAPPDAFPWNEREWRSAEVPGANAVGAARSIAFLYAQLPRLVSPQTLRLAQIPLSARKDPLLGRPMAFSVGFQLQTDEFPFGPVADAFGHGGSGGSCHGRWPSLDVGFSYSMNLLRYDPNDDRASSLLNALQRSLEAEQT